MTRDWMWIWLNARETEFAASSAFCHAASELGSNSISGSPSVAFPGDVALPVPPPPPEAPPPELPPFGLHAIIGPLQASRPAAKSEATCAYADFGCETPWPPAVSRPLCQPPPSWFPSASLPFRYFSSASRKSWTLTTDGSHAKYFSAIFLMKSACVCSLIVVTFSAFTYCCVYLVVSVCQPISSITKVSGFTADTVVGCPVPANAS